MIQILLSVSCLGKHCTQMAQETLQVLVPSLHIPKDGICYIPSDTLPLLHQDFDLGDTNTKNFRGS